MKGQVVCFSDVERGQGWQVVNLKLVLSLQSQIGSLKNWEMWLWSEYIDEMFAQMPWSKPVC